MSDQLRTQILRLFYAAAGAALVAFLQTLLASISGIDFPHNSIPLNAAGGFLATYLK